MAGERGFPRQRLADASLTKEKQARADVLAREASLRRELYAGDMANAWQAWSYGDTDRAKAILNNYLPTPRENDLRDFSWHYLNKYCGYEPTVLGGHEAPLLAATLAPNGHLLASADSGGSVKIWDIKNQTGACRLAVL